MNKRKTNLIALPIASLITAVLTYFYLDATDWQLVGRFDILLRNDYPGYVVMEEVVGIGMAALFYLGFCLVMLSANFRNRFAIGWAVLSLVLVWILLVGLGVFVPWMIQAKVECAEKGILLVESIESFKAKNGEYPESLDELKDKGYKVPSTGLPGFRKYHYLKKESSTERDKLLGGSDYVIWVPFVPGGTLVYRPDQNYADINGRSMPGGWAMTHID